ncbi:MAG: hypothetical protein M3525_06085 [Acidobacteriota bacterium]|nr:hypothetical protein [Acidobacteriota bacterium]
MKNLYFALVLVLVLVLSSATFAQTNATFPCPTISVTGPSVMEITNEPLIYTATVGKEIENYKVQYKWTVANGNIIERPGIFTVKVLQSNTAVAKGLTVQFEVTGLPEGCSNTASESMIIEPPPVATLIEILPTFVSRLEKAEVFEKLRALDNDPTAQIYIIFRHKKNTSQKTIKLTEQKLFDSLIKAGIKKERITLIKDSATDESIQFWLVPAGAEVPDINN